MYRLISSLKGGKKEKTEHFWLALHSMWTCQMVEGFSYPRYCCSVGPEQICPCFNPGRVHGGAGHIPGYSWLLNETHSRGGTYCRPSTRHVFIFLSLRLTPQWLSLVMIICFLFGFFFLNITAPYSYILATILL